MIGSRTHIPTQQGNCTCELTATVVAYTRSSCASLSQTPSQAQRREVERFHPCLRSCWDLLTARNRELVVFNHVTPDRLTLCLGNLTHTSSRTTKSRLSGKRRKKNQKEIKERISKLGVKG